MIITEVDIPLKLPISEGRASGVHQSAVIRSMAVENGELDKKWVGDDWEPNLDDGGEITDQSHILRVALGLAWEQWYLPFLADIGVVEHPGELELDGIYMNPDGESVDVIITQENKETHQLIIHECKFTYKSERNYSPDNQWMHMRQLLGYCKAKGTRYGMLHVIFACGDYSYPIHPTRKVWLLEFTKEEIDASWAQIKGYRDNFIRSQEKKK